MECNQDVDNSMANNDERDAMPRCSNESLSNVPILESKHKIFLSHSGAQKEFVEHLCKTLEDRWHFPFFDRRLESLPKGEKFPELIIQAAKQCEMLIVVVSNDYFMSKWPMIELNAFVKACQLNHKAKCLKGRPKILPLFYGLSLKELEDEAMQKKWFEKWETLAKDDPKQRIIVSDWKFALDSLSSFNGLEYKQLGIVAYEDEIASHVCKSIVPDLKWDDSHVQGKSSICKVIVEKIKHIKVSIKYHVKVVGIYGVGGIGKTTTCKTLSNELLSEYEGRVCHLEFPSDPSKDTTKLLQKALEDLTSKTKEVIQNLDEGKCKYALRTSLSERKVFLAIDNVIDNDESIKHAKVFLGVLYHKESLVIVTARSKNILERLGIDGDACIEMPELEEVDARKLFLHHAAPGKEFLEDEDKDHILKCIQRCYFSKGDGLGSHYHPLALEALGLQMCDYGENPLEWVKNLPTVRASMTNPIFDILRSSFNLLKESEQSLFLDMVVLDQLVLQHWCSWHIDWLWDLHKKGKDEFPKQLENLKQKGLLQDVDLRTGNIIMHDLYFEFVELEAKGFSNESRDLKERMWVHVDNGDLTKLKRSPGGTCWPQLIRLAIEQPYLDVDEEWKIDSGIPSLEGIQWDHFSNVEVLHLDGVHWGGETFNVECLSRLRVLRLFNTFQLSRLEGLGKLKNLTRFTWIADSHGVTHVTSIDLEGQLPLLLKTLHIYGEVVLGSDLLTQCHNLCELELTWVVASTLDLNNCRSLESMHLRGIEKLQTLLVFSGCGLSSLQSLEIKDCEDLVDIPRLNDIMSLKQLQICDCPKLKVCGLLTCTTLPSETFKSSRYVRIKSLLVDAQNFIPHQLHGLSSSSTQSLEGLNFDGFKQLEILDLSGNNVVKSLEGLVDLPALRRLELQGCEDLMRLPNLSKSKNLEVLNLEGCDVLKLHDKDIQMLSKLPLLLISGYEGQQLWLDFIRWKSLVHSCKEYHEVAHFGLHWKEEHEWEERDLATPPLTLKTIAHPFHLCHERKRKRGPI